MLMFCGFNGFGQFGNSHQLRQDTFVEFTPGVDVDLSSCENFSIATAWHYNAVAINQNLFLQGFLKKTTKQNVHLIAPDNIKQVGINDNFCLVLLENGTLYKTYPQNFKPKLIQVNLCVTEDLEFGKKRNIFGEIINKPTLQITFIACGNKISVAVDSINSIYSFPSKIYQFPKQFYVKQLCCGTEHALLLNTNGDIYSWGGGLRGQLGQDQILSNEETPILVDALAGIKINFIACGGWHSAAISTFGDLYTWGFNSNGQLGTRVYKLNSNILKEPPVFYLPHIIDLPKCCTNRETTSPAINQDDNNIECNPINVFSGLRHTIIQMSCGALFSCGWNGHSQLGLQNFKEAFCDTFKKIEFPNNTATANIQVHCGYWSTILLVKDKRDETDAK